MRKFFLSIFPDPYGAGRGEDDISRGQGPGLHCQAPYRGQRPHESLYKGQNPHKSPYAGQSTCESLYKGQSPQEFPYGSRIPRCSLLTLLLFLLLGCAGARGEEQRPVTEAWMASAGSSHLADTYLTPLRYTGWHTSLAYSRMQAARFAPGRLNTMLDISLSLDSDKSPARNATMWSAMLRAEWGVARRWSLAAIPGLTLAAGATLSAEGGAIYNNHNGNNPVAAKGAVTVNVTGLAAWRARLGRLPVTLTYRPTLPLAGAFFSPDYGELYYEIYLGNHSGLVHAAWPGSYFCLDNLVSADLRLWRGTALRLGYSNRTFSSKASGIVTRHITHAFVLGIAGDFVSLPSSSPAIRAY